jgi:hypothetical protein
MQLLEFAKPVLTSRIHVPGFRLLFFLYLAYAKSFRKLGITDPIAAPPKFVCRMDSNRNNLPQRPVEATVKLFPDCPEPFRYPNAKS